MWDRDSKVMTSDAQENLPAQHPTEEAEARLPRPHEYPGRSSDPQVPAHQGPDQAFGLTGAARGVRNPLPLRSDRDFRHVLGAGRRARVGGLTVVVAARPDPGAPSRLGMSVGTRAGGAVARNRIKRRLRAAFVAAIPRGHDVIVRADERAAVEGFQELVIDMETAVSRASG